MKKLFAKLRENRFWVCVAAIVLLFLIGLKIIDSNEELTLSEYDQTSFSADNLGFKGIYESLEKAGEIYGNYETVRNSKTARFLEDGSLYVCPVYAPSSFFTGTEPADIREKVKNGSTLILLLNSFSSSTDEADAESFYDRTELEYDGGPEEGEEETEDERKKREEYEKELAEYMDASPWLFPETIYDYLYNIFIYKGAEPEIDPTSITTEEKYGLYYATVKYGDGEIYLVTDLGSLYNKKLQNDSSTGAGLLVLCDELAHAHSYATLVFDEHYCALAETEEWDILGGGFIMGLIELCIAIAAYFIYKAMRFGPPEKLSSVEKRSETESVEALANLYRGTGAASIGFEVRAEGFLSDLVKLYSLPDGLSYDEIAAEILSDRNLYDSEAKEICNEYLNAKHADMSARKAEILIEKIESVKQRLF